MVRSIVLFLLLVPSSHKFVSSQQSQQERIADSLFQQEKLADAIMIYKQILANPPTGRNDEIAGLEYKIGHSLILDGKEKEALPYILNALSAARMKGDSIGLAQCYVEIGRIFQYTGPPDSALYYYEKALIIRELNGDPGQLADSYQNIAQMLRVIQRKDEAKLHIDKALSLITQVNDIRIIANVYNETAYLYELDNQLDSARYYYQKLIEVSEKNEYLRGVSSGYSNMASVLTLEKRYSEALNYYNLSLQIDLGLDYEYYISCSYRGIADCYFEMGDLAKAVDYIELAAVHCDSSWLNDNMIISEKQYRYYKASGDFHQALEAHERFMMLQDSLMSIENQKNMSEIMARYELEKKESQIDLLDKTNRLNTQKLKSRNLLLGFMVLLLGSFVLVALNMLQLKNHRINQMEIELHNFVSRMNISARDTRPVQEQALKKYMTLGLTRRESEILQLMQDGLSNRKIAERLFVSENTIKFHLKNIYIKLDVKNRTQAANLASM